MILLCGTNVLAQSHTQEKCTDSIINNCVKLTTAYDVYDITYDITSYDRDWDITAQNWQDSSKNETTYDANGKLTMKVDYKWDNAKQSWENNSKSEMTYDANGNEIMAVKYAWDSTTQNWENNSKRETTYDADGKLTTENYIWDSTTQNWQKGFHIHTHIEWLKKRSPYSGFD
ncbi:MAG: DUF3836 domain-containing protein [Prevotellaceae bacterium]|nr:DUF3836 domain-containing protein [Prevotellaceae bacterium]